MSEDNEDFTPPLEAYMDERKELLEEQKDDLLIKLKKIHDKLEGKEDIEKFLVSQMIHSNRFSGNEIKDNYKKCQVRFLIKF